MQNKNYTEAIVKIREWLAKNPTDDKGKFLLAKAYSESDIEGKFYSYENDICGGLIRITTNLEIKRDCALLLAKKAVLVEYKLKYYILANAIRPDNAIQKKIEELKKECVASEQDTCQIDMAEKILKISLELAQNWPYSFINLCQKTDCAFLNQDYSDCKKMDHDISLWIRSLIPNLEHNLKDNIIKDCTVDRFTTKFSEDTSLKKNFLTISKNLNLGIVEYPLNDIGNDNAFFLQLQKQDHWQTLAYIDHLFNPGAFRIENDLVLNSFQKKQLVPGGPEEILIEYSSQGSDADGGLNRTNDYGYKQLILCGEIEKNWQCSKPIPLMHSFCYLPIDDIMSPTAEESGDYVFADIKTDFFSCFYPKAYWSEFEALTYKFDLNKGEITFTAQSPDSANLKQWIKTFSVKSLIEGLSP